MALRINLHTYVFVFVGNRKITTRVDKTIFIVKVVPSTARNGVSQWEIVFVFGVEGVEIIDESGGV